MLRERVKMFDSYEVLIRKTAEDIQSGTMTLEIKWKINECRPVFRVYSKCTFGAGNPILYFKDLGNDDNIKKVATDESDF